MSNEGTQKTLLVALGVCLVCSILVSGAAVGLKGIQDRNRELDKLKNILQAGDLYSEGADIKKVYEERIRPEIVELSSGNLLTSDRYDAVLDPAAFDLKAIAKNPAYSRLLPADVDKAQIKSAPNFMVIYEVMDQDQVQKYILPIVGKGLWSTMYGFIALDKDLSTVRGFTFYGHGETPGLGGEVDNPRWKQIWNGKQIFDESGELKIEVIKSSVDPDSPDAKYEIDGLSGATITTRGVDATVKFWLGENGFGPFLAKLRGGVADHE